MKEERSLDWRGWEGYMYVLCRACIVVLLLSLESQVINRNTFSNQVIKRNTFTVFTVCKLLRFTTCSLHFMTSSIMCLSVLYMYIYIA